MSPWTKPLPPIPERMRHLPLFRNRLPVFYVVTRDDKGVPNWKVISRPRQIECGRKNWCHMCGKRHDAGRVAFIGAADAIRQRAFTDGPMHLSCALFAAQACPFLSNPNGRYGAIDPAHMNLANIAQIQDGHTNGGDPRPARMCVATCETYHEEGADTRQYVLYRASKWQALDWDTITPRPDAEADAEAAALSKMYGDPPRWPEGFVYG